MGVTATIQVSFQGANKNGLLTAELDSRPDGYNGGRTQFTFGDEPVFLVRKSRNVDVDTIKSTVGSVVQLGTGSTEEEEFLTYMNSKSANTNKPISGNLTTQWYGSVLGAIKQVGDNELVVNVPGVLEGVGVLGVNYTSAFTAYKLVGVPAKLNGKSSFNVLIAFIGKVDPDL